MKFFSMLVGILLGFLIGLFNSFPHFGMKLSDFLCPLFGLPTKLGRIWNGTKSKGALGL